jgi:cysteine desulfurase
MARQRERLWQGIVAALPSAMRHGDAQHAAPHILSVGFAHVPAEPLLHALEAQGVLVSAGSACHAKSKKPSPTLQALGVADHVGTIRLSLSRLTSDDEIERAIAAVATCVAQLS